MIDCVGMDTVIYIEYSNLNTYQVATSATLAMELAKANSMDAHPIASQALGNAPAE
jgi:hypothetical protein